MGRLIPIKASHILALDANIFISAYDERNVLHDVCKKLLTRIYEIEPQVYISTLVFEEFLVQIYKANLEKNIKHYETFLTHNGIFMLRDFDTQTARTAAKLRATYPSLKTPDAIHLASAMEAGATLFFSTDKRLPEKIGKLKIAVLGR